MSLFKKLLGGDFESNLADADRFYDEGSFGEAKLAYERAVAKGKKLPPERLKPVAQKIRECRRELAMKLLDEARIISEHGDAERSAGMLEDAYHMCDDPEVRDLIKKQMELMLDLAVEGELGVVEEVSDDGLLAIIAGTWTEAQSEEYAVMPDVFREGLLAAHDEDYEVAIRILEQLAGQLDLEKPPKYLHFELGETRFNAREFQGAIEDYDRFLGLVEGESEALPLAVTALTQKARALSQLKRTGEAKVELLKATDLAGEDHHTHLVLGRFYRLNQQYDDAIRTLDKSMEVMDKMSPDIEVTRELGFTYYQMGKKKEAKEYLKGVVSYFAAQAAHNMLDPETAVPLAKLYEEDGEMMAASDLYRHLAEGQDFENLLIYHLESARLLAATGKQAALAKVYLARAKELAESSEEEQLVQAAADSLGL